MISIKITYISLNPISSASGHDGSLAKEMHGRNSAIQ
jgi:hypothetical protein